MHIDGELHGAFIPKHVGCFGSFTACGALPQMLVSV